MTDDDPPFEHRAAQVDGESAATPPAPSRTIQRRSFTADPHRVLPSSMEAEQGVLCSALLNPAEVLPLCAEKGVGHQWFHIPAHGTIWAHIVAMHEAGSPIDIVTLTQRLHDQGVLETCGGGAMISNLFTFLPTAMNVEYYLETLQDKFQRRAVIMLAGDIGARAYNGAEEIGSIMEDAEKGVLAIREAEMGDTSDDSTGWVVQAIGDIQAMYERRGALTGLPTGLHDLDKMTDGMQAGDMWVIAARPSMGKTTLGLGIAEHIALECGRPVAVFSLEMSKRQLRQRLLCSRASINLARVRNGFLSERDFQELTRVGSMLQSARIFIDDRSSLSIQQLCGKARRMKRQHGIAAVFVDYLQLLRSSTARAQRDRQLEITEISSGLKGLAKELEIPIVVLAQLNRNPENRNGALKGKPRLSDLRESGSIEQDADLVGLLYREEYYAEDEEEKKEAIGRAELIVAKARNGPTGDVKLTFLKEFTRFESRIEVPDDEPSYTAKANPNYHPGRSKHNRNGHHED